MKSHKIKSFFKIHFYYKIFHSQPDFIIIGAPKSGTTSLFHYLSIHSDIIPSEYKEPAFFAWHNSKGYDWYLSKFPKKSEKKNKLTFEATPLYLFTENTPMLINKYLPDVKLIAILRDPVDRAYSHWNFYNNSKYVNESEWRRINLKDERTFEEAIDDEMKGKLKSEVHAYLDLGHYADQLERYFKFFDKKQILVLDFNDLKNNLNKTMTKVCQFLGVSDNIYKKMGVEKEKLNEYIAVPKKVSSGSTKFVIHNANKYDSMLSKETYLKLSVYYKQKNKNLSQLTGINFSWN